MRLMVRPLPIYSRPTNMLDPRFNDLVEKRREVILREGVVSHLLDSIFWKAGESPIKEKVKAIRSNEVLVWATRTMTDKEEIEAKIKINSL